MSSGPRKPVASASFWGVLRRGQNGREVALYSWMIRARQTLIAAKTGQASASRPLPSTPSPSYTWLYRYHLERGRRNGRNTRFKWNPANRLRSLLGICPRGIASARSGVRNRAAGATLPC